MKKNLLLILFLPGITFGAFAANSAEGILKKGAAVERSIQQPITGVVKDNTGQPLVGVSVSVKGTNKSSQTNVNGGFTIDAEIGQTLVFTYIGFVTEEVQVSNSNTITIELLPDSKQLNEVVVTALGVQKQAKSLTYSTQRVSGAELTKAKDANLMNSLTGKAAGVQISRSASGAGGSVKVNIRGSRSVSGSNDPLYVIDGVPMSNFVPSQPNSTFGSNTTGNRDQGDGIGNINPDDVESISVLKGASAAALYGSQASNGVVLITTKKGRAGTSKVDFSSSLTMEDAVSLPSLQTEYGQTSAGALTSWGPKTTASSVSPDDFLKTGTTFINSLSFSSGGEKAQNYFSYANTSARGIIPTNSLNKHNFTFRESAKFFNDKVSLDANLNLIRQTGNNRPTSGYYNNPFSAVYLFPRGLDFSPYKKDFEVGNPARNVNTQNWFTYNDNDTFSQNPYWVLNRMPSVDKLNRGVATLNVRWDILNYLNFQVRGSVDRSQTSFEQKMNASTSTVVTGTETGRYIYTNSTSNQYYADALLNFNKPLSSTFTLNGTLGTSITDNVVNTDNFDTGTAGLKFANIFTIGNMNSGSIMQQQAPNRRQLQAVFGSAQLGIKDAIFIDVTGRNDWSSTLAFSNSVKSGYFYPSAGISAVLSQLVKMPEAIDFGKIRFSYAKVGNDFGAFVTNPPRLFGVNQSLPPQTVSVRPGVSLKPELSTSLELGTEWRFFNDKLTIDFTAFKTNTTNQLLSVPAPSGNFTPNWYINAGDIQNKGIELALGLTPVRTSNFSYTANLNYSLNRNKVISLGTEADATGGIFLTNADNNSYNYKVSTGRPYGDIYGVDFERDANGKIVSLDGVPKKNSAFTLLGNPAPDFLAGLNNNFKYKNLSFSFLVEGRFGGDVMSMTQGTLDLAGVSQASAEARNAGFVMVEGSKFTDVAKYYGTVGGRAGVSSQYIYDGTVVRLREAVLGYTFPTSMIGGKVIKGLNVSLIGRNLFYISKDAPFDPEIALSSGNGLQGVDVFGLPAVRSFGLTARASF